MDSISRTLVALASVLVLATSPATAWADEASDPTEPGSPADEATEVTDPPDSPAVRGFALALDAPSYTYVANTDGGWSDVPRTTTNVVGSALRGVAPIGDRFGLRLGAAGSFAKYVSEDEASLVRDRWQSGWFDLDASAFWRSPGRASLGLGYRTVLSFSPRFDSPSTRHALWLGGALFLGDFDLDGRLSYAFGTPLVRVAGGADPKAVRSSSG